MPHRQKQLKLIKSSKAEEGSPIRSTGDRSLPTVEEFYQRAEQYAQRIRRTQDVSEIIGILDTVLSETRELRYDAEMLNALEKIRNAEERIEYIKHELMLIRELVNTDTMTGLFNRRGLEELFIREAARSDRNNSPLCVIMVDLDNFKEVNETHGYPFGDSVLINFANILKNTLRPSDLVARQGGEEFVILLPDTTIDEAVSVLQRLQRALADKPRLNANNQPVTITFSGGIALRLAYEQQHSVISRAGEALFHSNNSGKSRIEIAP